MSDAQKHEALNARMRADVEGIGCVETLAVLALGIIALVIVFL